MYADQTVLSFDTQNYKSGVIRKQKMYPFIQLVIESSLIGYEKKLTYRIFVGQPFCLWSIIILIFRTKIWAVPVLTWHYQISIQNFLSIIRILFRIIVRICSWIDEFIRWKVHNWHPAGADTWTPRGNRNGSLSVTVRLIVSNCRT